MKFDNVRYRRIRKFDSRDRNLSRACKNTSIDTSCNRCTFVEEYRGTAIDNAFLSPLRSRISIYTRIYFSRYGDAIFLAACILIHPFFPRRLAVKEDEGRTFWLDTQSHASSSASSADDDYSWQWPTSFWSQFKVSTARGCFQQLPDTMPFRLVKRPLLLFVYADDASRFLHIRA